MKTEINYSTIDPYIRNTVHLLNSSGLVTTASCQGGTGHQSDNGFVVLECDLSNINTVAQKAVDVLIDNGYKGFTVSQERNYQSSKSEWEEQPCSVRIDFWYPFDEYEEDDPDDNPYAVCVTIKTKSPESRQKITEGLLALLSSDPCIEVSIV